MDEPKPTNEPAHASVQLFSDEIRRREAARRREGPIWSVCSFLLHLLLFAVIVLCTPVRQLVFSDEEVAESRRNAAEELSSDKIEEIGDKLSEVREKELERALEAMQSVLHNMDLMKEELQKDYDAFAEKSAEEMRETVEKAIDEAEKNAQKAEQAQKEVLKSAERIEEDEASDVRQESVMKDLYKMADAIKWNQSKAVNEAQANAQNALDRAQSAAEFAGFQETADKAEKLRDEQIETAREQSAAQDKMWQDAEQVAKTGQLQERMDNLKKDKENWAKDKAEAEKKIGESEKKLEEAGKKFQEAQAKYQEQMSRQQEENGKARQADREFQAAKNEASRERNQERADREKAQSAENKAQKDPDNAEKYQKEAADALASAEEHKGKAEAADKRAEDLQAEAAEHREQAAQARDAADQAAKERSEANQQERDAKTDLWRANNTISQAETRTANDEKQMADLEPQIAKLEQMAKDLLAKKQSDALKDAAKKQTDIRDKMKALRDALSKDSPSPDKLVDENRKENELATQSLDELSMLEAYELAKQLEKAVTESFKDLKATQTAIENRMSFNEAQKLTDVPMAIRPDLSATRDAIESNPRNKEELDRQKEAQSDVVREAENILDTLFSMMSEAQSLVMPDSSESAWLQPPGQTVKWMEESDFGDRDSEEALAERLAKMQFDAEFALEIGEAAAEDAGAKAKDLADLMAQMEGEEEGDGDDKGDGEKGHGIEAKTKGETDGELGEDGDRKGAGKKVAKEAVGGWTNGEVGARKAKGPGAGMRGESGGPPSLAGTQPELLPGNVLHTAGEGFGAMPGRWMYVNDWYVIGPFPNPNRSNLRRKFPPESVVDLDASYVGKNGRKVKWEFRQGVSSVANRANRAQIIPAFEEYSIWYAYSEVFLDKEADLWVAIGSDDRSDVWLNDMPIWGSGNELKAWNIAEGYRRVHFRKGRNTILLRLENGHGPCGFSVCISTGPEKTAL